MKARPWQPYSRWKVLKALIIAYLPGNALRVFFYRQVGFDIGDRTKLGFGTIIACESFRCGVKAQIGRANRFIGPLRVQIGDDVCIGRFNQFLCGPGTTDPAKAHMNYARTLDVGDRVLINDHHYFDVYGRVSIGAGTWVAGVESQFWTHGASAMDRDIAIGSDCYLGSAVRMAPGSSIGNGCVLGIASVVVSKLDKDRAVFAGFPARLLREITDADDRTFVFQRE